jgi:hypothetical protein
LREKMKVTLKKTWRSPRGNLYPAGTTFTKSKTQTLPEIDSTWYDFVIPGRSYGIVLISDKIHKILTKEEKELRELRKKQVEEHIRLTDHRLKFE